jgi:hypothetical protein
MRCAIWRESKNRACNERFSTAIHSLKLSCGKQKIAIDDETAPA